MLVPVRCFTCGKILADKIDAYNELVRTSPKKTKNKIVNIKSSNLEKTAEGDALDILDLSAICCRRHMLTYVDLLDVI